MFWPLQIIPYIDTIYFQNLNLSYVQAIKILEFYNGSCKETREFCRYI